MSYIFNMMVLNNIKNSIEFIIIATTMVKYSHAEKKALATKISKLTNDVDIRHICSIIKSDPTFDCKTSATENSNGLFMYFHKLDSSTYGKIKAYIESANLACSSEASSDEVKTFTPYKYDEYELLPSEGQKLKYSNKERNLLKRKKYEQETPNDSDFVIVG